MTSPTLHIGILVFLNRGVFWNILFLTPIVMQELQALVFVIFQKNHPENQQMWTYCLLLMLQESAQWHQIRQERPHPASSLCTTYRVGGGGVTVVERTAVVCENCTLCNKHRSLETQGALEGWDIQIQAIFLVPYGCWPGSHPFSEVVHVPSYSTCEMMAFLYLKFSTDTVILKQVSRYWNQALLSSGY